MAAASSEAAATAASGAGADAGTGLPVDASVRSSRPSRSDLQFEAPPVIFGINHRKQMVFIGKMTQVSPVLHANAGFTVSRLLCLHHVKCCLFCCQEPWS